MKVALSFIDLNKVAAWAIRRQEEMQKLEAENPPPPPDPNDPHGGPE